MKTPLAILAVGAIAFTGTAQAQTEPSTATSAQPCQERCKLKVARSKLRRSTPREPIPTYITACESGFYLRAHNDSGAGGRYQIMPGTWRANLPSRLWIRISEGLTHNAAKRRMRHRGHLDKGPRWSSRLLQDKVAETIYAEQGPSPWSCA